MKNKLEDVMAIINLFKDEATIDIIKSLKEKPQRYSDFTGDAKTRRERRKSKKKSQPISNERLSKILTVGEKVGLLRKTKVNKPKEMIVYEVQEFGKDIVDFLETLEKDQMKEIIAFLDRKNAIQIILQTYTFTLEYGDLNELFCEIDESGNETKKESTMNTLRKKAMELHLIEREPFYDDKKSYLLDGYSCTEFGKKIGKFLADLLFTEEEQKENLFLSKIDTMEDIKNLNKAKPNPFKRQSF